MEGVDNPGAKLAAFRVAKILSAERHPQADKLQVLSVDAGDGPLQVVEEAPPMRGRRLDRRVRRAGCDRAFERHGAEGGGNPGRRVERHDVFDARA